MANVVILQTIREDAYIQTVINQNLSEWVYSNTEDQLMAAGKLSDHYNVMKQAMGTLHCWRDAKKKRCN